MEISIRIFLMFQNKDKKISKSSTPQENVCPIKYNKSLLMLLRKFTKTKQFKNCHKNFRMQLQKLIGMIYSPIFNSPLSSNITYKFNLVSGEAHKQSVLLSNRRKVSAIAFRTVACIGFNFLCPLLC